MRTNMSSAHRHTVTRAGRNRTADDEFFIDVKSNEDDKVSVVRYSGIKTRAGHRCFVVENDVITYYNSQGGNGNKLWVHLRCEHAMVCAVCN